MKEKVLITGASGFVGYHLIVAALKNNLEVFAAIRKTSKIDHLDGLDIQFTYPDFNDVAALTKDIQQNNYQYIIHAAGALRARAAQEYNQINTGYTANLARAAKAAGTNFKKFVLISSLAALGPLNDLDGKITEDTLPNPVTAYGKSKLGAELLLKKTANFDYTILRPTAVYGPRDKDIFIFIKQVANGFEPYIGTQTQHLSFIYVTDLAGAAIAALQSGDKKAYNLSDGNFYSRYEMAAIVKQALNKKTWKVHIPVNIVKTIVFLVEKAGNLIDKPTVINIEKLNELKAVNWYCAIDNAVEDFGFKPRFDLTAGLADTLKWYKTNKWL